MNINEKNLGQAHGSTKFKLRLPCLSSPAKAGDSKPAGLKNILLSLIIFSLTVFPTIASTSSKTTEINRQYATALWYLLTNSEISQEEILSLNKINLAQYDEFAKKRVIKESKTWYKQLAAKVKNINEFSVRQVATLGEYNFDTNSFPVMLPDAETIHFALGNGDLDYVNSTTDQFGPTEKWGIINYNVVGMGNSPKYYGLNFDIPEDVRTVSIDKIIAEKLMKRLNQVNRSVIIKFFIKPVSADEDVHEIATWRNISFKVTKATISIPGPNNVNPWFGNTTGPKLKEILIKTWVPGKNDKKYDGPNIEGTWSGTFEHTLQKAVGATDEQTVTCKVTLNIIQKRCMLSGTSLSDVPVSGVIFNPLSGEPAPETREGLITGELTRDDNFSVTLSDPKDNQTLATFNGVFNGKEINGTANNVQIKLVRGDANNNPEGGNEKESTSTPTDNASKEVNESDDSAQPTPATNSSTDFPSSEVAIIFNIPGVTKLNLVKGYLINIYQDPDNFGNWHDDNISRWNPDETFPNDLKVVVVHNSNDELSKRLTTFFCINKKWAHDVGVIDGSSSKWPTGVVGTEDDGVAELVNKTPGAIGFVHMSYAVQNNLPTANIDINYSK